MVDQQGENPGHSAHLAAHRAVLTITLIFVLVTVTVSTGLVVYTAWLHDLKNGLFALLFATLSARAVLSWCLWHRSYQPHGFGYQQDPGGRKPAGETRS